MLDSKPIKRVLGIDYLKGIAAFTVLSGHILDNYCFYSNNCSRTLKVFLVYQLYGIFFLQGVLP